MSRASLFCRLLGSTGRPESKLARRSRLAVEALEDRAVPATFTVTSLLDTVDSSDGVLTLREAITAANSQTGADIINFSVTGSITLSAKLPELSDDITITGPGANPLTISGDNKYRIFTITNSGVTAAISGLTLSNGSASGGYGGGIYTSGTLTLTNCTVSGNTAQYSNSNGDGGLGGGIFNTGKLILTNCTVSGNTARAASVDIGPMYVLEGGVGGGIYNTFRGTLTLTNCTVTDNTADGENPFGGLFSRGATRLVNTIVAANSGKDILIESGQIDAANSINNVIGTGSSGLDVNKGNLVGVTDPKLGPLADNGGPTKTHALLPGSPAINAGTSTGAPDADQRGVPHFGGVDIGAYEFSLVVDTTDDVDNGNYAVGDLSLREAIKLANANPGADTITFAPTVFGTSRTITLGGTQLPTISGDLTITGPRATLLTIDANSKSRIFQIAAGTTVGIGGLTLIHGNSASQGGGGILNFGTLTLTNSTLTGNSTSSNGVGGGIANFGTLMLNNSTLSGNSAGAGGGIANGGTLTLTNSTISGNSAGTGGGIANGDTGTLTVTNSTISGNSASTGGGIRVLSGSVTLNNTIVAGNMATTSGSDISGTVVSASANNLIGDPNSSGGLAHGTNGNIVGQDDGAGGRKLLDITTVLAPLADNGGPTKTHALVAGSPAINAGSNALVPADLTTDQRGVRFARVLGGTVDIGAYEAQSLNLVVDTTDDEDDGNYGTGDLSLREAIKLANANPGADTITFNVTDPTINLSGKLPALSGDITITGPGANFLTVRRNTTAQYGIFLINRGVTATISSLTISNGSDSSGGGIANAGTLTLTNTTLSGNSASDGGGIANFGALTLTNTTLSGNSASNGGGIYNGRTLTLTNTTLSGNSASDDGGGIFNGDRLTVTNSTLTGNSAGYGGGINNRGTLTLTNSTLTGNSASNRGGSIDNRGTLTLTDCTVSDNTTGFGGNGGGIYNGGTLELISCTVSGNISGISSNGGGIYNNAGTLTLTNCTLSGNTANSGPLDHGNGGGIYNESGTLKLTNCTFSNNTAVFGGRGIYNQDGTLTLFNTIVENSDGLGQIDPTSSNNLIGIDAKLGPLADNGGPTKTHALLAGSPAINAGTIIGAPATDQRGLGRVGKVDIGAFEDQHSPPTDITLSKNRVAENRPAGTVVGTFSTTDPDPGDTFTYTLVGGNTRAFTIDASGNLKTARRFDYEAKHSYSVRVRSTDARGLFTEKDFTLRVMDVNEGGPQVIAVGSGTGAPARVRVLSAATGAVVRDFSPFPGYSGGVTVATGDVNHDGTPDVIVGTATGASHVKVFDGVRGSLLFSFLAFDGFKGGLSVASGDVNHDGFTDVIVGTATGSSHVKTFDGHTGALIRSFLAFPGFVGGVSVGAGDVNHDGFADVIVGTATGSSHVKAFDGRNLALLRSFLAFGAFPAGVSVAGGDLNGDGFAEVLVGANANGHVKAFDGRTGTEVLSFLAYPGFGGGVRVGSVDANGDGRAEILTGAGPRAGPHVKRFDGQSLALLDSSFAFDPNLTGGVFVG